MEKIETRGLPVPGIEQVADVEGFARQPGLEAGRRQQVVERHDQPEAVFGRVERFQV